jgi:hypothetical protein
MRPYARNGPSTGSTNAQPGPGIVQPLDLASLAREEAFLEPFEVEVLEDSKRAWWFRRMFRWTVWWRRRRVDRPAKLRALIVGGVGGVAWDGVSVGFQSVNP